MGYCDSDGDMLDILQRTALAGFRWRQQGHVRGQIVLVI
jgi:hypothetical protein